MDSIKTEKWSHWKKMQKNTKFSTDLWFANHDCSRFNPFNPEFTIVIFILYKPRIAAAILDL